MAQSTEILKGTLALLILRTLELEPRHGVIGDDIRVIGADIFPELKRHP